MINILRKLWERNGVTNFKLEVEDINRLKSDTNIRAVNYVQPFSKQGEVFASDFAPLNTLIVDDNTQYYFHEWVVQIYEAEDLADMEYMINLISSNFVYNIIYQEDNNLFDFYNIGDDLRQMGFFSVEGTILFYHISVFIKKTFGAPPITIPTAKIEIFMKPFLTIKI